MDELHVFMLSIEPKLGTKRWQGPTNKMSLNQIAADLNKEGELLPTVCVGGGGKKE